MSDHPDSSDNLRYEVGRLCGLVAFVIGLLVLLGWVLGIPALKSVVPGLPTMKVNTALAIMLAGISLWSLASREGRGSKPWIVGVSCSIAAGTIVVMTLSEYAFSVDLGIDELFLRDDPSSAGTIYPGRVAPATAATLCGIITALLLFHSGYVPLLPQLLTGLALVASALSCLGHLYGAQELYTFGPFASVAVHTGLAMLTLCVGMLSAGPATWLTRLLLDRSFGGIFVRRVLPAAIAVPVLMGWLRLRGQQAGLYDTEFGIALFAMSNIGVFVLLVFLAALQVKQFDSRRLQADEARRQSEKQFEAVVEASPTGLIIVEPSGRIVFANVPMEEMFGYSRDELLGMTVEQLMPERFQTSHPGFRSAFFGKPQIRAMGGGREFSALRKDGSEFPVELGLRPLEMEGNPFVLTSVVNISNRKHAEDQLRELNATLERRVAERTEALREQEERFRGAFDEAPIGIALVALDGRFLRVNRALCALTGYAESELLATTFSAISHPSDADYEARQMALLKTSRLQSYDLEARYLHKAGNVIHAVLSVSLVRDGQGVPRYTIKQLQNITDRKRAEQTTQASLREKEVLLKEIHHRVKNNLQIVSTLLDLQSEHTADQQALQMFKESQGRVRSMALIHERLYRSKDLAGVDFKEYVRQLTDDLYRAYKLSDDMIVLDVDVDVPPLPIDIAIPCGLLINELISNALKHAFGSVSEGSIRVVLHRNTESMNVLTVADSGVGIPSHLDFRNTRSFGLQLVNTLVEQLNGSIELVRGQGTTFSITFPDHK